MSRLVQIIVFSLAATLAIGEAALAQSVRASSDGVARGIVVSQREATLATELTARIAEMSFLPGASFNKGDVLVAFDCKRYAAQLTAARAEEKAANLTVRENRELRRHRAVGATELEVSLARQAKAKAQADALEIQMGQCELRAPFAGRVVKHNANVFEIPRANEPLISIIDDTNLELDLLIDSDWLVWLKTGTRFKFRIDEIASEFPAEIKSVGAAVDPVSQTIRVKADFLKSSPKILPGMSGSAVFGQITSARSLPKIRAR